MLIRKLNSTWLIIEPYKAPLLLLVLAFVVFGSAMNAYFVSDDFDFIRNVVVASGKSWWYWFTHPQNAGLLFYRPLHNLYFIVHYNLFGLTSWPYHLSLIIMHAGAGYLFYLICRRLQTPETLAVIGAVLFLIAPVHAESVAWITGGVSVLAGLPALASLYFWIRGRQDEKKLYFIVSSVFWAISLMAKESVITWPLVLLATDLLLLSNTKKGFKKLAAYFPIAGVALVYILMRQYALGTWVGGYNTAIHTSFSFEVIAKMFSSSIMVFFTGGALKYYLIQKIYRHLIIFFISFLAIALAGLFLTKYKRLYLWGAVIFAVTLAPQLNLGINILNSEGERYLYLPSLGLAAALTSLLFSLKSGFMRRAGTAVFVLLFVSILISRVLHWRVAGEYSQRAVREFSSIMSRQLNPIFLGVPDNYRGAFIFRNGLNEALKLNYPSYEPSPWIAPMRSYLFGQPINWEVINNEAVGKSPQHAFVGQNKNDQYYEAKFANVQATEPRYNFTLGREFRFKLTDKFFRNMDSAIPTYVVFTEQGLSSLEVKAVNN